MDAFIVIVVVEFDIVMLFVIVVGVVVVIVVVVLTFFGTGSAPAIQRMRINIGSAETNIQAIGRWRGIGVSILNRWPLFFGHDGFT